jgi:AcrR family transcriptional regulator
VSAPDSKEEEAGLPAELARLPRGRHGLPAEFVEHNQRERLVASLTALVGEKGYGEATIAAITAGAGVSSRTFYQYFETVEEAYVASFDKAIEDLREPLAAAFSDEPEWPAAVRAALEIVLVEFTHSPDVARLLTAEPFVAGPQVALRHKAVIEQLVPYLRRGRELAKSAAELPDTTERGLLGAVSSMVGRQAFGGEGHRGFTQLGPDLLQFLLTPYLGPAEAHRLATAPA